VTGALQFEANVVCGIERLTLFEPPGMLIDGSDDSIGGLFGFNAEPQGVGQNRLQQGLGGMGADDLPLETVFDQVGNAADMVDAGVGEKKGVDLGGRDGPSVYGPLLVVALGQTAVDHDDETVDLEQVAGAGDAVFGTEMK